MLAPIRAATITESAILVRIDQLYRPGMAGATLYDVTRGVWRVGPRRAKADLVFAVVDGIVVEVYRVSRWHPAGTTAYASGRQISIEDYAGRWEFTGVVAEPPVRNKYTGCSVAAHFAARARNPVRYVNVDAS